MNYQKIKKIYNDNIKYLFVLIISVLLVIIGYSNRNNINLEHQLIKKNNEIKINAENVIDLKTKQHLLINKDINKINFIDYKTKEKVFLNIDTGFVFFGSLYGCGDCVKQNLREIINKMPTNIKIYYILQDDSERKYKNIIENYKLKNVFIDNQTYFDEYFNLYDYSLGPLNLFIIDNKIISFIEGQLGDTTYLYKEIQTFYKIIDKNINE